ncbi:hypothetical protein BFN67_09185 [Pseudaminobacter manganicus]|uniref:Uncharacterized protein n=1 Tax=Manganibacter manganicus TaxID=1873176 RepID=A0A1V8RKG7_9HYPH|nr:hypothetical protein BFN67_09185 [Pseudaminobacter manganicus]
MASWLARSVLVLFAVLVVAAVILRFSIALPAMELGDSDVQVAELAFERCCSIEPAEWQVRSYDRGGLHQCRQFTLLPEVPEDRIRIPVEPRGSLR